MLTFNEAEKFMEFLEDCFGDGVTIRELRLSNEETEYIKKVYPKASFNKNQVTETPDGKAWYKVILHPSSKNRKITATSDDEMLAIQNENLRLKQELERLKSMQKRIE